MKKIKLAIFFLLATISVFLIYKSLNSNSKKINYIAIGDSLAEGMNSYGVISYGYADYLAGYLEEKGRLMFYTKAFAKSGYTTKNVLDDIENNKKVIVNNQTISIKEALRESDLVTISIGANDFMRGISITNITSVISNINDAKTKVDTIAIEVEKVVKEIKKYAKEDIILISYYNPLPRLIPVRKQINEIVEYSNSIYKEICIKEEITCLDIFEKFDKAGSDYLPNTMDIHPNNKGYEKISDELIKLIK